MAQYIDKSALVAEIERQKAQWRICKSSEAKYRREMLDDISSFLDTLEVKEVDFDALGILAEHLIACEAHGVAPKYRDGEIDILEKLKNNKAQKGE